MLLLSVSVSLVCSPWRPLAHSLTKGHYRDSWFSSHLVNSLTCFLFLGKQDRAGLSGPVLSFAWRWLARSQAFDLEDVPPDWAASRQSPQSQPRGGRDGSAPFLASLLVPAPRPGGLSLVLQSGPRSELRVLPSSLSLSSLFSSLTGGVFPDPQDPVFSL